MKKPSLVLSTGGAFSVVNRCTGCLMEISIEPGNYRTGRGRKPSARERVRRRARAETKAEERAVENRSRCVGQLDASRDLARPAKGQSGGRARRGEVASVERAPSCSKPKSMATGMSSRPSLSTGSSWIRAMLPPTRDSKATNRRRRARRVIFRSRAWRWRRTQCRDRTRPRGKRQGGSDARHFSDRMPIRGDQTQSARVSRARIRHASHGCPTDQITEPVRTCPLPLEGGTSARVTTSGSCVCPNRFGANPRQETEDAARPSPRTRGAPSARAIDPRRLT